MAAEKSRIHSRAELYEKAVKPLEDKSLLKHHLELLFAWAEERATEVSQERYGGQITSLREAAMNAIEAYHDTWYTRIKTLADDLGDRVSKEERERAVVATRNDAQRAEKAFFALANAVFADNEKVTDAAVELGEAMAALGDDLALLTGREDAGVVQTRFRELAVRVLSALKMRAQAIGAADDSPMRKYLVTRQTAVSTAGNILSE